ncbi:hypothetical protein [Leptolyngbya sp. BL0902]|uniref:hypothetical protein n=1 Tax=Leptolyngbya sp. BL0902 TaxID=1115757 RepID=UPI0018E7AD6F|nr:hypothetical protein [Leptolyngbya sp. BL0902]
MKLWLLCFVLLFAAAQGLHSVSGGLSLSSASMGHPLVVLAGIGLAIMSNAKALGLGAGRSTAASQTPPASQAAPSPISMTTTPTPPLSPTPTPPPVPTNAANAKPFSKIRSKASSLPKPWPQARPTTAPPKTHSISFDLRQPK